MKPEIPSVCLGLALLLPSCSDIVFATRTSAGLEITGDANKVPTHVNFGFRRRELIYAGPQAPKDQSMLGRIDSETTWTEGAAIRETVATGRAAEIIADPSATVQPTDGIPPGGPVQPLVFASRTRVGIGINLGGADDDAIPSGYLGYSRRVATRIRTAGKDARLPSVVADISVHTTPLLGGDKIVSGGLHPAATLSPGVKSGGARIRQFFAIGQGAETVLETRTASPGAPSTADAAASPAPSGETIKETLKSRVVQTVATGPAATSLGNTGAKNEAGNKVDLLIRAGLGLTPDESETPAGDPATPPR